MSEEWKGEEGRGERGKKERENEWIRNRIERVLRSGQFRSLCH